MINGIANFSWNMLKFGTSSFLNLQEIIIFNSQNTTQNIIVISKT